MEREINKANTVFRKKKDYILRPGMGWESRGLPIGRILDKLVISSFRFQIAD